MSFWVSSLGAVALNIAAAVLWDGARSFGKAAAAATGDARELRRIAYEVQTRTAYSISSSELRQWLNDEAFWRILAESARDVSAQEAAAKQMTLSYCSNTSPKTSLAVLTVLLVEISHADPELSSSLRDAKIDNRFDVLEHSLGYVMEEIVSEVNSLVSGLGGGFENVNEKLDLIITAFVAEESEILKASLREIKRLADEGILMPEAAVELQIRTFLKASEQ